MNEKVLEILQDIRPDVEFEGNNSLVDNGDLESLDVVALIGELNDEFDIDISVEDIIPENFNSLQAIVELINRLQS